MIKDKQGGIYMKSRKIFLSVLALALVGTVVASCGGDKPSSSLTTSEQPQTSETTSSVEEVKTKAVYTGFRKCRRFRLQQNKR